MTATPELRLADALRLLEHATPETAGLWSRAAALLARQALEQAVTQRLTTHHFIAPDTNYTARLHALYAVAPAPVAQRAAYAWAMLSRATHHVGYELPPTQAALRAWVALVADVLRALR